MKNDIKDIETLDLKVKQLKKKKRIYLFSSILIILAGIICLYLKYPHVAIPVIVLGALLRFFYYLTASDIKSYEKLKFKISNSSAAVILLISLFFSGSIHAIQPGDRATELSNLKWIKGTPVTIFNKEQQAENNQKHLFLIENWSVKDNASLLAVPILYGIKKKYKDQIDLIAVSADSEEDINTFLTTQEGSLINYSIALDPSQATIKCFAGHDFRIPQLFVVSNIGQLLWRGHPIELKRVLKNIFNGTFDLKKQQRISRLHNTLQSYIQLEDISQIKGTTEKLLNLVPDDDLALRVMLYDYQTRNKTKKALEFINKHIEEYPDIPSLYPLRLDVMNQNNFPLKTLAEETENILTKFPNNHKVIFQTAEIAVNRFPFATIPVKQILTAAEKAVELLKNSEENDDKIQATYLSVLAKAYYFAGKLENAVETQQKVLDLLLFPKEKKAASNTLDYYKNALDAYNSKNI